MKYLAGFYGVTVLIAAIYFDIWGQYAYRSFFFNLGRALVWPAIAFPTVGTILSGLIWLLVIGAVLVFVRRNNE